MKVCWREKSVKKCKKCEKELPDGYKGNKCEACKSEEAHMLKKILGIAGGLMGAVIIGAKPIAKFIKKG